MPEVTSVAVVVLGFALNRMFRMKAKLLYSVRHSSTLLVEEPLLDKDGKKVADRQAVRTASIIVENAGLLPAKAVEITFNWKPPVFNVIPARAFQTEDSAFARFSTKFDSLAPGE